MPVLVFELDARLELRFVNHSCKELLGFSPNEALHTPHWFLTRVHPSDVPKVQRAFMEAFGTQRPFSLECRMLHKKGAEQHGIIRSVPLTSGQAEKQYIQAIFLDISDRVYIEKAMVQSEGKGQDPGHHLRGSGPRGTQSADVHRRVCQKAGAQNSGCARSIHHSP